MLKSTLTNEVKANQEINKFTDKYYTKKIRLNHCLRQYNTVKAIIDEQIEIFSNPNKI